MPNPPRTPKPRRKPDPEVAAMKRIVKILDKFDGDEIGRMLWYLRERYTLKSRQTNA